MCGSRKTLLGIRDVRLMIINPMKIKMDDYYGPS